MYAAIESASNTIAYIPQHKTFGEKHNSCSVLTNTNVVTVRNESSTNTLFQQNPICNNNWSQKYPYYTHFTYKLLRLE